MRTIPVSIVLVAAVCVSCSDVPAANPTGPTPQSWVATATSVSMLAPVLSVQISPPVETMRVGEIVSFSTKVELGEGVPPSAGGLPFWSSTNPAVILVESSGKATAVEMGRATIEVRAHGRLTAQNIQVIP